MLAGRIETDLTSRALWMLIHVQSSASSQRRRGKPKAMWPSKVLTAEHVAALLSASEELLA
jgi:hypothetical protein